MATVAPNAVAAMFAPRPMAMDMLHMELQDMLDEDGEESHEEDEEE